MTGPDVAIHYGPGGRPLCGAESWLAVYTDDPDQVSGCDDCLNEEMAITRTNGLDALLADAEPPSDQNRGPKPTRPNNSIPLHVSGHAGVSRHSQ